MSASRGGFAARLLLAQTLVILIGAVSRLPSSFSVVNHLDSECRAKAA